MNQEKKEKIFIGQTHAVRVYNYALSKEEVLNEFRKRYGSEGKCANEAKESVPIWYKDSNGKYVHIVVVWDRFTGKICKYVDGVELLPSDETVMVGSIVVIQ